MFVQKNKSDRTTVRGPQHQLAVHPQTRAGGEARPTKSGVRYTFNCVLWSDNLEHLLSASCVGFGVP